MSISGTNFYNTYHAWVAEYMTIVPIKKKIKILPLPFPLCNEAALLLATGLYKMVSHWLILTNDAALNYPFFTHGHQMFCRSSIFGCPAACAGKLHGVLCLPGAQ